MSRETARLALVLERGFRRAAWHGPNLAGALRGVQAAQAAWRPARGRHNIWEIVLHTAYWKHAVRRRVAGSAPGTFTRSGSNWPRLPKRLDEAQWREDVRLLRREHRLLLDMVAALPDAQLDRRGGRRWTNAEMIEGVAMHDIYHAGQIQLLKRLYRRAG